MTQPPKVVAFCPVQPEQMELLIQSGCRVVKFADREVEAILRELGDGADAAVASTTVYFDDALFTRCPRLRVVGRMGVGVDNIDLDAATRHGVQVVNTPLPIIEPVAEHALALLLALSRSILRGDRCVRKGQWRTPTEGPGPELAGKTLGIIGFGNTGRRLAEICHLGLGMRVVYHDVQPVPAEVEARLGARRLSFDEVLSQSDGVSVHVNLSPRTRGLIDARAFSLMKPSAWFLNCSRGPVVDEAALVAALRERRIAGAGLDVLQEEPPPADHPLFAFENVVLTPHRAGQSSESLVGCSKVVEDIVRVLRGEPPRFPVNRPEKR
jgi:phosphoglycerate dehydrogenase-like enzyme